MAELNDTQKKTLAYHLITDMIATGTISEDIWEKYVIENPISCFPKGPVRKLMTPDAIKKSEELHPSPARWRNIQAEGGQWQNVRCRKATAPLSSPS